MNALFICCQKAELETLSTDTLARFSLATFRVGCNPHPQETVITNNGNQNFGLEIMLPLKCLGFEH